MRSISLPKLITSKMVLNHPTSPRTCSPPKKYVTTNTQNGQSIVSQQHRLNGITQSNILSNRQQNLVFSMHSTTTVQQSQATRSQPTALSTELMEILQSLTDPETLENMMAKIIKVSKDIKSGKIENYVELNDRIKIPLRWSLMESIMDALIELNKPQLAANF